MLSSLAFHYVASFSHLCVSESHHLLTYLSLWAASQGFDLGYSLRIPNGL